MPSQLVLVVKNPPANTENIRDAGLTPWVRTKTRNNHYKNQKDRNHHQQPSQRSRSPCSRQEAGREATHSFNSSASQIIRHQTTKPKRKHSFKSVLRNYGQRWNCITQRTAHRPEGRQRRPTHHFRDFFPLVPSHSHHLAKI